MLRSRNRARAFDNSPFDNLDFYQNMMIYEPQKAVIESGKIATIYDSNGGSISFGQGTAAQRPTQQGALMYMGTDRTLNIGLVASASFSYYEVFLVAQYGDGTATTFVGFPTLVSGTGLNGDKRIIGADTTANLSTASSIHPSGLVQINDGTPTATSVLPLPLSVINSATDFTTPTVITDAPAIGYNLDITGRGWTEYIGAFIFIKNAGLTASQRTQLTTILQRIYGI